MEKNKTGFTLIELLVVVAILGLLASIILTGLRGARLKARNTVRLTTLDSIQKALELYNAKYGYYPLGELEVGDDPDGNPNCGMNPFDIIKKYTDPPHNNTGLWQIMVAPCGIQTIDRDTSLSNPWIPQLGPSYPACSSVGEGFLGSSWIKDPKNEYPVRYAYWVKADLSTYEITATLEEDFQSMQNDGGNNPNLYEVGPGKKELCGS